MVRTGVMRLIAAGSVVMASVAVGPSAYGLASAPKPPAAPQVVCGAVLTADATLTADLVCPNGNGLTMDAPGITLDLNGHSLIGPGSETENVGVGVSSAPVTIRGGTISGWGYGIWGGGWDPGWPEAAVVNVVLSGNGTGVRGVQAHYRFERVTFVGNNLGIDGGWPFGGFDLVRSTFRDNDWAIRTGGYVKLARATIERSGGVFVEDGGCEVSDSRFVDNATALSCAWYVQGSVTNNTFVSNDVGLYTSYGNLNIEGNVFRNNAIGLQIGVLDHSVVRGNTFTGNGTGVQELFFDDGIDSHTILDGNKLSRNGDGIYTTQQGVTLQGNVATNNAGWGIYTEGAVDLGGNIARHNGNDPQCYGVTCLP